ncbi:MAG: hypothetical protein FD165_1073 [Gammaproteobacteria bacterium]|nr:MAG: hypothetical protein FD165_1073 [Gammaproteobacteria bacterium]TND06219.1 MAG: hypothetical protein FD120_706 [Gammaproteobacteria bacterium]
MAATNPSTDWLQGLADIEWPAAPDWSMFYLMAVAALVVLGAMAAYIVWRWRRPARRVRRHVLALAKLAALQTNWQRGAIDDRAAAYQLATILRLGLGLEQLAADCPALPHVTPTAWRTTIAMLHRYRYSLQAPDKLPAAAFDSIRGWLQRATNNGTAA